MCILVRPTVASKLGETRPLPQVLGTGRGWGEFYENILGNFGLGWEKPFWGQIVPLPENLRNSGTGTRTVFSLTEGTGWG